MCPMVSSQSSLFVAHRFTQTFGEAFAAGLLATLGGFLAGVLLHRHAILERAVGTWVAAFAAAPAGARLSAPPGRLRTIGPDDHHARLPFGHCTRHLEDPGSATCRPPGPPRCRRRFKLTERQLFWQVLFPAAIPTIFVGIRLGLIFALINVVGVEFLINFGGLGQLINDLAERYDMPGTYASPSSSW
jgi:NitT/TauT family transport system permease protein